MVTNMKLAFTNFRHYSACVIQKWLRRLKRVITVKLAYISQIFLNGSEIMELLFSKSCVLVNCRRQRSYMAVRKKIILKRSFPILNTILYF